jgi:hypothetical protein
MAKIVKRRIRWVASEAADVVGYRVYWNIGGGEIDIATAPSKLLGNVTQAIVPDDIPELASVDDQDVTIGIASVDDVGNESDLGLTIVPFDTSAPDAPTGVTVDSL